MPSHAPRPDDGEADDGEVVAADSEAAAGGVDGGCPPAVAVDALAASAGAAGDGSETAKSVASADVAAEAEGEPPSDAAAVEGDSPDGAPHKHPHRCSFAQEGSF